MSVVDPSDNPPSYPVLNSSNTVSQSPKRNLRIACASCAVFVVILLFIPILRIVVIGPRVYYMPSESMEPTIMGHDAGTSATGRVFTESEHDRLIVSTTAYRSSEPKRNDIVVFTAPPQADMEDKMNGLPLKENVSVKRIVAVGGDSIWIHNAAVWSKTPRDHDFRSLSEPFILEKIDGPQNPEAVFAVEQPLTLKANEVFVLGDNRNDSNDSRFWGPLDVHRLTGKVMTIINPNTGASKSP